MEAIWGEPAELVCERLQKAIFTDAIFFIVLDLLRDVILAPNWKPIFHFDSLSDVLDAK